MSGDSLCTVKVVLLWPVTVTPTDGMSTVARQVYWPASDVLTGSRMWVRDGPEPLTTSLLLGATHWSVGVTFRTVTTDTVHSRACWPPAVTVESIVVVTSGDGSARETEKMSTFYQLKVRSADIIPYFPL